MAENVEGNVRFTIDATQALATIRNLQKQLAVFHSSMAQAGAGASAESLKLKQNLLNSVNATGAFNASMVKVKSSTEAFTHSLENNKMSMGEYFRYAGGATKTFGKMFKTEFSQIQKVAESRVKTLQTRFISMGRDANGALQAIKVRPLALDMQNLTTQTMMAAQKQQLFNQLMKQGSTQMLNWGKNTQWAGRQLMVGFTIPLTIFASTAAKAYMEIEKQTIAFKRVYGDFNTTKEQTDAMAASMKNLANEFTQYGVAVADTMDLAAKAAAMGKVGADLQAQVKETTRLAVLGGVDQQQALDTTISLTNAFGVASDQLAGKIDFLNAVENQTVTSISDLTEAIPKAGPVIQQLGGDVEDLTFFLTAMREGGINASEGANALKSGLASIINPTTQASKMLQGFGINIQGILNANKGDVKGLITDLASALDKLDPTNRAQAIEQMFGKFQFSRISTLFQNVIKDGSQAQKVLQLTNASTAELATLSKRELAKISDSPMFKFQKAVTDFQTALAPIGEEFLKAVTPLITFGTDLLKKFDEMGDGAKQVGIYIAAGLGVVGPVFLMITGLVANGIANLIKFGSAISSVFTKLKGGTGDAAFSTEYLTQAQLNELAVTADLDAAHSRLKATFSAETGAVKALAAAYRDAANAQSQLEAYDRRTGTFAPAKKGRKMATGGIVSGPGTGTSDSVPTMLSTGEAVIPAKQTKKYRGFIDGMISNSIPGFAGGGIIGQYKTEKARRQASASNAQRELELIEQIAAWKKAGLSSSEIESMVLSDPKYKWLKDMPEGSRGGIGGNIGFKGMLQLKNAGPLDRAVGQAQRNAQNANSWNSGKKIAGGMFGDFMGSRAGRITKGVGIGAGIAGILGGLGVAGMGWFNSLSDEDKKIFLEGDGKSDSSSGGGVNPMGALLPILLMLGGAGGAGGLGRMSRTRRRYANGIVSVPGPKGAGDVVPAMLSPGEAVIPAGMAKKYGGLINGMIAGSIPGYYKGYQESHMGSDLDITDPKVIDQIEARYPGFKTLTPQQQSLVAAKGNLTATLPEWMNQAMRESSSGIDPNTFEQEWNKSKGKLGKAAVVAGIDVSTEASRTIIQGFEDSIGKEAARLARLEGTPVFDRHLDAAAESILTRAETSTNAAVADAGKKLKAQKSVVGTIRSNLPKLPGETDDAALKRLHGKGMLTAKEKGMYLGNTSLQVGRDALPGSSSKNATPQQIALRKQAELERSKWWASGGDVPTKPNPMRGASISSGSMSTGRAIKSYESVTDAQVAAAGMPLQVLEESKRPNQKTGSQLAVATAKQIADGAATEAQTNSPSRVTRKIGQDTAQGYIDGVQSGVTKAEKTGRTSGRRVTKTTGGPITVDQTGTQTVPTATRTPRRASRPQAPTVYEIEAKKAQREQMIRDRAQAAFGTRQQQKSFGLKTPMQKIGGKIAGGVRAAGPIGGMMAMGAVGMGVGMIPGMEGFGTAISTLGPLLMMLPGPVAAVAAGLAVLVGVVMSVTAAQEKQKQAAIDLGNAQVMSMKKLTSMSEDFGTVSATDARIAAEDAAAAGISQEQLSAGQQYLTEMASGQQLLADVQKQQAAGTSSVEIGANLAQNMATAVAQNVITQEQGREIIAALGSMAGDRSITANASGVYTGYTADITQAAGLVSQDRLTQLQAQFAGATRGLDTTGMAGTGLNRTGNANDSVSNEALTAVAGTMNAYGQAQGGIDSINAQYDALVASAKTQKEISNLEAKRTADLTTQRGVVKATYDELVKQKSIVSATKFDEAFLKSFDKDSDMYKTAEKINSLKDSEYKTKFQADFVGGNISQATAESIINAADSGRALTAYYDIKANVSISKQDEAMLNRLAEQAGVSTGTDSTGGSGLKSVKGKFVKGGSGGSGEDKILAGLNKKLDKQQKALTIIQLKEDAINKKYDERAKALEKIQAINQRISEQQRGQMNIAQALASGNIAGAADAAQSYREQQASRAMEDQKAALEQQRQNELSGVGFNGMSRKSLEAQMAELQMKIAQREYKTAGQSQGGGGSTSDSWTKPAKPKDTVGVDGKTYTAAWDDTQHAWLWVLKDPQPKAKETPVIPNKPVAGTAPVAPKTAGLSRADALTAMIDYQKKLTDWKKAAADAHITALGNTTEIWDLQKKGLADNKTTADNTKKAMDNTSTASKNATSNLTAFTTSFGTFTTGIKNAKTASSGVGTGFTAAARGIADIRLAAGAITKAQRNAMPFAGGGIIPNFKAMGTDVIPAMLTPGEFVVSQPAVKKFGVNNLKAINNGSSTASSSSVYNYSVTVNAQSGSNADQIANTVLAKIKKLESHKIRGNSY